VEEDSYFAVVFSPRWRLTVCQFGDFGCNAVDTVSLDSCAGHMSDLGCVPAEMFVEIFVDTLVMLLPSRDRISSTMCLFNSLGEQPTWYTTDTNDFIRLDLNFKGFKRKERSTFVFSITLNVAANEDYSINAVTMLLAQHI
jgi:hypothetical protein